jgi:hypothetical protein
MLQFLQVEFIQRFISIIAYILVLQYDKYVRLYIVAFRYVVV